MNGKTTNGKNRTFTIVCMVLLCVLTVAFAKVFGFIKSVNADAKAISDESLHACTKITEPVFDAPSITVLTHGYGCDASAWSNDYYLSSSNKNESFNKLAYNSESLIAAIGRQLNDDYDLYYMKGEDIRGISTDDYDYAKFDLHKLDLYDYSIENKEVDRIATATKHIVLLFESGVTTESHQAVYKQFGWFLDTISMQYKELSGKLPRYNLVAHSRGGITNIQYATEHPYNVAALFSLGTPYNGSALGEITAVLELLGMAQDGQILYDGVKDIMDESKSVEIRNAWNAAYTPDADINAVAYGTMTSFDFARKFIEEVATNNDYNKVSGLIDILTSAVDYADNHPADTQIILDVFEGLIEIVDSFLYGCYGASSEMSEDIKDILKLYQVINGKAVLMDDLFIDVNSQLGLGFSDGIGYNGFKRYVKIFDESDYVLNRAQPTQPAAAHNLEPMNAHYVKSISKSLVYGKSTVDVPMIRDNSDGTVTADGSHALKFVSNASANRRMSAPNSVINLYSIDENNRLKLESIGADELSFTFKDNESYLFVFKEISQSTVYSFNITDMLNKNSNVINLAPREDRAFMFTPTSSGYYILETSAAVEIEWGGITKLGSNKYYIYLDSDVINPVIIKNNLSSALTISLIITEPDKMTMNEKRQLTSADKVYAFTNPYVKEVEFQLKLTWQSGANTATVYRSDNTAIGSFVSETNAKTIFFTLAPNEVCYVVYDIESSASVEILPSRNQLKWKIDGTYMSNDVTLARGNTYNIQLVLFRDGEEFDCCTSFSGFINDAVFKFTNNNLEITYMGDIGDNVVIIPLLYPEYPLRVTAGMGREDYGYIVTLDKAGGSGGTDRVEANYNRDMPYAIKPFRTGYRFLGFYADRYTKGRQYYDSEMQSVRKWDMETDATLYAQWEPCTYRITFNQAGGVGGTTSAVVMYDDVLPLVELPKRTGYNFLGYFTSPSGGKCYYEFFNPDDMEEDYYYLYFARVCDFAYDITLYAQWESMTWSVGVWASLSDRGLTSIPDQSFRLSRDEKKVYYVPGIKDYEAKSWRLTYSAGTIASGTETAINMTNLCVGNYDSYMLTIYYLYSPEPESCVAAGTMITLSDGSRKAVEDLTGNEMLLVWNMRTGAFDSAPILFIDRDPLRIYKVINLEFSDGTVVRVVSEHGFWDFDLNRYVYLDENAAQYIGHWFNKQTENADGTYGWASVRLDGVKIEFESTEVYSPVTYSHLCYYVDGMLSIPGGIMGLFNIFEVDEQTLKIDEKAFLEDLDEYGLFTYEEFFEIYPVSEKVFEAFNGKYLKVAIGKGIITYNKIGELIERYSNFF